MKMYIPSSVRVLSTSQALGTGATYTLTVSGIFTMTVTRLNATRFIWQICAGSWVTVYSEDDTGLYAYCPNMISAPAGEARVFCNAAATAYITGVYW